MTYWLNGEFYDAPKALDIADRGFLLGDGVFETLLVVNGVPAFLEAHLTRMRRSLRALSLDFPVDEKIGDIIAGLAKRNGLCHGSAAARLTVTRGSGPRGLLFPSKQASEPTCLVTIQKYSPRNIKNARLLIGAHVRCEHSLSARHKTLNYLDNVMARNEAARAGADDAVMLNSAGRAACASAANIFRLYDDGAIVTPPTEEGALPGIVRGLLLDRARQDGFFIAERPVEIKDLQGAPLFITNSLIGLCPAYIAGDEKRLEIGAYARLHRLQSWYEDVLQASLREEAEKH